MEIDEFDSIIPSRYKSFTIPTPDHPAWKFYFRTKRLRIAILDSHSPAPATDDPPAVCAVLVPQFRETDWIYGTQAGISQLLSASPEFSRMIVIGNDPSELGPGIYTRPEGNDLLELIKRTKDFAHSLLVHFLPQRNRILNRREIPFLKYEDNVVGSKVLERFTGPVVGEFLVEDVLIEGHEKEFRRKLRFKRSPNLVQTEIKIVPVKEGVSRRRISLHLGSKKFRPDLSALVHIYLAAMAASLSLASAHFQNCIDSNTKPRVLCLGVGGGALLGFLATQLGFEVLGLEVDTEVLRVAMKHFGLEKCDSVRASNADGIDFLKIYATNYSDLGYNVIMVDMDPGDSKNCTVPPSEFMQKTVISAAKGSLSDAGLLVLNVIPKDKLAYENLIHMLKEVFVELYQIDLGNQEHFVVAATVSRVDISARVHEDAFLKKLRLVTSSELVDSIQKI